MSEKINKYAVPALDKAIDVLEYLATQMRPLSQTEIAHALGRSPNEIYRVLIGLEHRGYLNKEPTTGHYSISMKVYHLSRSISPTDHIRQVALPLMEDLAAETGLSSHLSVLYQSQVLVLVHARSPSAISLNIREGAMFSAVDSVSGRVLVANSNASVRTMILQRDEQYSGWLEEDKKSYVRSLDLVVEQGFYIANNPQAAGVQELATIIGEYEGKLVASLAVSSFDNQLPSVPLETHKQKILFTACSISQQLKC